MSFLELNLYEHPSGVAFDAANVIQRVKAYFPEATVLPGDQLAAEASRAETFLADELRANPDGPARVVVESLRRKAAAYGPAFAFRIPAPKGGVIQGLARSVNVQFLFEDGLPAETRNRLIEFLKSLGIGRLQASTDDSRQVETLYDLQGPSDCLSQRPGVPWHPGSSLAALHKAEGA
jgi:hypothetical protein